MKTDLKEGLNSHQVAEDRHSCIISETLPKKHSKMPYCALTIISPCVQRQYQSES